MRTKFFSVAAAAALAVWTVLAASVFAQAPGGAAFPPQGRANPAAAVPNVPNAVAGSRLGINGLAVVDVAYIFKNHARFKQQMDDMKKRVEAAVADMKRDQEEIKRMAEQLKQLNAGTPDYKRLEADALKKQGELQIKDSLQKKDFMEQEGRIYFKVSQEINDAVKLLAANNGITLVLRFNGDQVDPSDRNDILRGINQLIVYYDPRMDITPYILQDLNRSAGVSINPNNTVPVPRR